MASTSAHPCHHFSLAEIQSATNDFDNKLIVGRGGFGKVYKAHICIEDTSHVVAIKKLDTMSDQGAPEFWAEIEMLTKLRHCHLVSLIGYCDDNKEMILVYEYMPHGTLYDHSHKASTPLNWVQRLRISIGAARGLDYLHTGVGTKHGVIHRDVKSSNILLDENWDAMISDFGLSKITPTSQTSTYVDASVKGTFGYLDPEYFYTKRLTRKTDMYAFGVVLFEILSGRLPVDESYGEEHCSLVRWAQKCVKERKIDQIVDPNIRETIFPKCLRQFAQIAYRCLLSVPKERPTMAEVVASLQVSLALQQKYDSEEPSGLKGFALKMHKYFVSSAEGHSDQSVTRSQDGSAHGEILHQHVELVHKDLKGEIPHQHVELVHKDLKMFTYDELKNATMEFSNDTCLGKGDLGAVYKGWVSKSTYSPSTSDEGSPVTIRKVHSYKHFDLEMLKEFCHPNLVELIGYCLEGEQLFLVYEFMHNGSFENLLHSKSVAQLPLVTKVKIAAGIARGIVFLHQMRHGEKEEICQSQLDRDKILLSEVQTSMIHYFRSKLQEWSFLFTKNYKNRPTIIMMRFFLKIMQFTSKLSEIIQFSPHFQK